MALDDDISILSAVRLFEGFTQEQLRLLAFGAETTMLHADHKLYREDDVADSAYIVVSGRVVLYREHNGERIPISTVGPGTMLSELALIRHQPAGSAYARSVRSAATAANVSPHRGRISPISMQLQNAFRAISGAGPPHRRGAALPGVALPLSRHGFRSAVAPVLSLPLLSSLSLSSRDRTGRSGNIDSRSAARRRRICSRQSLAQVRRRPDIVEPPAACQSWAR